MYQSTSLKINQKQKKYSKRAIKMIQAARKIKNNKKNNKLKKNQEIKNINNKDKKENKNKNLVYGFMTKSKVYNEKDFENDWLNDFRHLEIKNKFLDLSKNEKNEENEKNEKKEKNYKKQKEEKKEQSPEIRKCHTWNCLKCTFKNHEAINFCEICGTKMPNVI